MLQFPVLILFSVAEFSCIGNALVSAEENSDFLTSKIDVQQRLKRWLWGDEGCGLIPGCEKCTDGLICEKCRSSFIPVEYERNKKKIVRCTRSCPMGFNMTSRTPHSTLCVRTHFPCRARNCIKCQPQNPTSCLNCNRGYYSLQKSITGNVRCVRHCPIDYTPTERTDGQRFCKDPNSECLSVVPNCAKCFDSVRCRKCRSDFHAFFNKSQMVCVRNCPNNLVAFNTSHFGSFCKKPPPECTTVAKCARCPDKINCRRCKPRHYKLRTSSSANSTCVSSCPLGFFKKGRRCQRLAEDGCLDEHCLACRKGWHRIDNLKIRCLRKCPDGFYTFGEKQKFCLRCIANCEQCTNGYDCVKCNPEFSRFKRGVHISCARKCPSGYVSQEVAHRGKFCLPRRTNRAHLTGVAVDNLLLKKDRGNQ